MSALSVGPEELQTEPIVGWRVWRVVEVETLAGTKEVRLAAAGTMGLPPLWPPLEPMVAVCSVFDSRHEAPWPYRECGVYALRTRRLADERLGEFVGTLNGEGAVAWAVGRVSLWGRVVECERGWRGQYAYPYELTVVSGDATLARRLSAVYAIDVAAELPRRPAPSKAGGRTSLSTGELAELQQKLRAIKADLEEMAVAVGEAEAPSASEAGYEEPITFESPVSDEELLLALVALAADAYGGREEWDLWPDKYAHAPFFGYWPGVCEAVLSARGVRVAMPHRHPGYDVVSDAVAEARGRLVKQGLLEVRGWPEGNGDRCWREIEARRGTWTAERLAAKAKGKAEYRRFIEKRRREDKRLRWSRLRIPDDEVRAAVEEAVAEEEAAWVGFAAIADRLLPGHRTQAEAVRLNAALRRLYEGGLISKHGRGQWDAAKGALRVGAG